MGLRPGEPTSVFVYVVSQTCKGLELLGQTLNMRIRELSFIIYCYRAASSCPFPYVVGTADPVWDWVAHVQQNSRRCKDLTYWTRVG